MDYNQFINLDYFFYKIYQFFVFLWDNTFGLFFGAMQEGVSGSFAEYLSYVKVLVEFSVLIFLTIIIYSLVRVYEIRKGEREKYEKVPVAIDAAPFVNKQWEVVLDNMKSDSPSDWRLAVIEADNMLDLMVKKMGYEGEDLGERLKAVEPSDFDSLQSAWEAHKVRNQIVHEGVGFEISKRDAERVIGLYEKVFREFGYI